MNDFIDINDANTYPIELKKFCKDNQDILKNTITEEFSLDYDTFLAQKVIGIIKKYKIIVIHATRIYDIKNIYEKGLLIPSKSTDLIDIMLNPISTKMTKKEFENIKVKLIQQICANDKYSRLHFVVGSIDDITIEKGFWMLNKYGGELLEDIFTDMKLKDFYFEDIASMGEAYAIKFKVSINDLNKFFLTEIIAFMLEKMMFVNDKHIFKESYILENIEAQDIIRAEKIKIL